MLTVLFLALALGQSPAVEVVSVSAVSTPTVATSSTCVEARKLRVDLEAASLKLTRARAENERLRADLDTVANGESAPELRDWLIYGGAIVVALLSGVGAGYLIASDAGD